MQDTIERLARIETKVTAVLDTLPGVMSRLSELELDAARQAGARKDAMLWLTAFGAFIASVASAITSNFFPHH